MIVKEFYRVREDGVILNKTYSNIGMKIHKVGTNEFYDEAIDVDNAPFEYEETAELISKEKLEPIL